jgi:hypothetical protein
LFSSSGLLGLRFLLFLHDQVGNPVVNHFHIFLVQNLFDILSELFNLLSVLSTSVPYLNGVLVLSQRRYNAKYLSFVLKLIANQRKHNIFPIFVGELFGHLKGKIASIFAGGVLPGWFHTRHELLIQLYE